LAATLAAALSAQAQDAAAAAKGGQVDCITHPDLSGCAAQEVVVTGSRIKRADLTSIEPISTITSEEIQQRGFTNIADIVNELPEAGAGLTPIGNQNSFGVGRNYIDLFSLGSQRTLTLVNGQRFVGDNPTNIFSNTGGNQVDLNVLPTLFVDHIETVLATGAAVYGTDAISGVVNIILKKSYQGVEADASYGISTYGDAPHYKFEGAIGQNFLDDRLNVAVDFEYDRTNALTYADRPWTAAQYAFVPNPNAGGGAPGQILVTNNRFSGVTEGGLPFQPDGATPIFLPNAAGGLSSTLAQFGANGNLVPFNPGTVYGPLIGGTASGGDSLNNAPHTSLQTPLDRKVADFITSYRFSDHLRFTANIDISSTDATEQANQPNYSALAFGPSGAYNDPIPGLALLINPDTNAFLTPQARSVLAANGVSAANGGFYLSRANTDISPDPISSYDHTFNFQAGLDGDFTAINRKFEWSVSASAGNSFSEFNQDNIVFGNPAYNVPNLFGYALDSVVGANGQPQCNVTAQNPGSTVPAIANCVPFNPFGAGNNSKAALQYITANFGNKSYNAQEDVLANIGTTLLTLPAGDFKVTTGFEYRRDKASFTPDLASAEGIGYSVPISGQIGAYDTNEYYVEGVLPLLSPTFNFPGAYKFELEGAFRYVKNSIAGSNNAWSFGGRYSPIKDITLRGSRSNTFGAPSLTDLFASKTNAYDDGVDPCQASNINAGPNPAAREKNCAAAFAALGANLQNFTFSNVSNFTIPVTAGGNPQLKNELGQSYTYGLLLEPRFAPGLSFAIDYVHIDITDAIEYFGVGNLLESCYDSPTYPSANCADFTRDNTGQVVSANEGYVNAGFEHFVAVTYDLGYERPVNRLPFVASSADLGNVSLNISATNTHSFIQSYSGLGFDDVNYAGTYGTPRWRWKLYAEYSRGPLKLGWITQDIGASKYNLTYTTENQVPLSLHQDVTHSLTSSYEFHKGVRAYFNMSNIFNQGPPIGASTAIGNYYDYIGRYFTMGVSAKF
jgi:outer membrane receptor protein involved in Fe transport